ncbi:MAG: hypothetical protein ACRCTE_13300 [Cellulosilyticaceae bacterium]
MFKKIVSIIGVTLLLTGCNPDSFAGSRTGNTNQFILVYDLLNGTDSQSLTLEKGDKIAVEITNTSGSVDVEVRKDQDEPIYTGMNSQNLSFILNISESGTYQCSVTGRKAKGSVSFIKQESTYEVEPFMGYIAIKGALVEVDPVELITTEQDERMNTLGLMPSDFPNGYYIYNEVEDLTSFSLTEDTSYNFTDVGLIYSQDEENRFYTTHNISEFINASSYQDKPLNEQKIPYKLQVYEDKIISISEEFALTQ